MFVCPSKVNSSLHFLTHLLSQLLKPTGKETETYFNYCTKRASTVVLIKQVNNVFHQDVLCCFHLFAQYCDHFDLTLTFYFAMTNEMGDQSKNHKPQF